MALFLRRPGTPPVPRIHLISFVRQLEPSKTGTDQHWLDHFAPDAFANVSQKEDGSQREVSAGL